MDVRIVAATNQELAQMVHARRFRADLYYRLNVFPIALPPLRERPEDIPALVCHFVRHYADAMHRTIDEIPPHVLDILCRHEWRGNIRELQNFIERAMVLTGGSVFEPPLAELKGLLPPPSHGPAGGSSQDASRTLADVERLYIAETLRKTRGVIGGRLGAAAQLGMPRTTLIARMRKLGITRAPDPVIAPGGRMPVESMGRALAAAHG